ncbi:hypothetical protein BGZ93_006634 [Podila epicladia]|nr:hypothetical protein BGZ92_004585 [Podila epicladia]KAG0099649.1 hypothetical protein BGZ93_006634 [Podila epicladia]
MPKQPPLLVLQHTTSLSIGGIVRYRIALDPSNAHHVKSLLFRVRNTSPVYRNLTPGSGPWKLAIALVRNPDKTPAIPDLVPSLGCAQISNLEAIVVRPQGGQGEGSFDGHENEWELEVMSEMVLHPNWVDIKIEILAQLREDSDYNAKESTTTAIENFPQTLYPGLISCQYKDTAAICGASYPKDKQGNDVEDRDLHLVVLTHGIHGSWLDMLYLKEQIDAHNAHHGKTVTLLTDTNHAGTEEGIQMAGQRVAHDILQFTGYCDTEEGKRTLTLAKANTSKRWPLSHVFATAKNVDTEDDASSGASTNTESHKHDDNTIHNKNNNAKNRNVFPRRFSKISFLGHSLGGLINIYALGYIQEKTAGRFFAQIQPAHFLTIATPLLGVGFEHPWVLGYALAQGVIGQTGKDLSLKDRSGNHAKGTGASEALLPLPECELDISPEPLLVAMARPGSVSNSALKMFKDRTSYANIDNDMAVRFQTSTMMGIPTFDMDQYFSPEGASTQPKRNLYSSAVSSTMALMFPGVPSKKKLLEALEAPSPIVVVSHVDAVSASTTSGEVDESVVDTSTTLTTVPSATSLGSHHSSSSSSSSKSTKHSSSSAVSSSSTTKSKSRQELAELVAQGYHTDMDWTKIGVYIANEAHVQIIVRRKWYNLDGWKCVQDVVERHNFS